MAKLTLNTMLPLDLPPLSQDSKYDPFKCIYVDGLYIPDGERDVNLIAHDSSSL